MNRSLATLLVALLTSSSALVGTVACSSDSSTVEPAANTTSDASTAEASNTPADSGVCSDEVGTASACSFFLDGGAGLPDGGAKGCLDERSCKNLLSSLKPRVAQRAIECLAAIPECTVDAQIQNCVVQALRTACPDPSGAAACDEGFAECPSPGGSLTKAECLKWTAGMTGEWRTVFPMCLGTSNGCGDPLICVPY
jgi:hypothetical protein